MVSVLRKFVGDTNKKTLKKISPIVSQINELEGETERLADAQLRDKTGQLKARLAAGETLDDLLPEAFAAVREVARRHLSQRHYDMQLTGGVVLHWGQIAEMKTGEGKTLVATLPVYLNALTGQGVHVVTVNDYLARRDPVWMGPIYHGMGLSVACLQHDAAYVYDPDMPDPPHGMKFLRQISRAEAYQADVTYGTNNEFGFDHLRDNMALEVSQRVQRELHYAIVDEVDNILIDEARTPLIVSGPAEDPVQIYYTFAKLAHRLQREIDFTIDERTQAISLTQEGISNMERWMKVENLYEPENFHLVHYIENALTAQVQKRRDKDYVVRDGEVVIVDEFTGRLQFGRRWSDGLHQAVEAKEGVKIQRESITYATITLQNYFRMYRKLAGMTGTAATEADEFFKIYGLEVTVVPTNLPMVRTDAPDLVFQTVEAKWQAVVNEIAEIHGKGHPILVGTTSIEASEQLSERLKRRGRSCPGAERQESRKRGGHRGPGGSPGRGNGVHQHGWPGYRHYPGGQRDQRPGLAGRARDRGPIGGAVRHSAPSTTRPGASTTSSGGAPAARGDPGSSRFFGSLEDELMRRFGGDRIKTVMGWTGINEDTPIENRLINKSISNAQVKVESYHFDIRKHLLEYDDVLNMQREIIYTDRHSTLAGDNLKPKIVQMIRQEFTDLARKYLSDRYAENWNVTGFVSRAEPHLSPAAGPEQRR